MMPPDVRKLERLLPAYHREIVIDSANGTIMRLSAISDLKASFEQALAAILVKYAPIAIGDRTYVCPVKRRGIVEDAGLPRTNDAEIKMCPIRTELNDVAFTQYHLYLCPHSNPREQIAITSSVRE